MCHSQQLGFFRLMPSTLSLFMWYSPPAALLTGWLSERMCGAARCKGRPAHVAIVVVDGKRGNGRASLQLVLKYRCRAHRPPGP